MVFSTAFILLTEIIKHPANQREKLKALLKSIHWQIYKRLTNKPKDIPFHGLRLRCFTHSHSASRAIYFSQLPDFWEMNFICDYLKDGDSFIDAGANIGLYSLLARSIIGENGHIDAFEPSADTAELLKENIQINKLNNIDVHQVGLANKLGSMPLVLTGDDCTAYITNEYDSIDSVEEVPVVRLDQYLDKRPYAMAKFDIEGYEPFAIRGASHWLKFSNPAVMLIELAGYSNRHGIATSDFIEELKQLGYFTAYYCPETKVIVKTDSHWEIPLDNVLAIAYDKESFVGARLRSS